jgi:antitoxin PrlF
LTRVIQINGRGTLTLPKELRQRLGLQAAGPVVVEETDNGLLLRPGVTVPVEIYSTKRVAEFAHHNDTALAGFKLK